MTLTIQKPGRKAQQGSALIAIVAALVVFSALTAALLPMISSSGEQTALALTAGKAFYLAESGYRYAVSRYRHPDGGLKESDMLDELDQQSFSLDNGDRFHLAIYSYFLTTSEAIAAGQTSFTAHAPGSFPADELDPTQYDGQKIQLNGATYTITSASLDLVDGNELTLAVDSPLSTSIAKELVYPVIETSGTQSLSQGGNIVYDSAQGYMFPLRNGLIVVEGRPLLYRFNNRDAHRLEDVREPDPEGAPLTNLNILPGSSVLLAANTRIESTGIAGGEESETRRKITYYSALGVQTPSQKVSHQEDFSQATSSFTDAGGYGSTTVDTQAGVLKVTAVDQGKVLAVLKAEKTKPFSDAHRSSRGYINYDAQTKVGFTPEPNWANADFGIGLSFRLRPDGGGQAGYGLSFLKSRVNFGSSGIPAAMVPPGSESERAIVLWQQPRADVAPVWLAYKKTFEEPVATRYDFESGEQGWSTNRDWERNQPGAGGSFAFHYENRGLTFAAASLRSPEITLGDTHPKIRLVFRTRYENSAGLFERVEKKVRILDAVDLKPVAYTDSDGKRVEISKTISRISSGGAWLEESLDLSRVPIRQVVIEFLFDVAVAFQTQTWSVDDVRLVYEWPINDSTLAVRLQEAAVIEFNQGGPQPIEMGDQLLGESSGASGAVITAPILGSGNWSAGNATGTILLNALPPDIWFSANENLLVVGKGKLARLKGAPDQAGSRKVNVIKAYYAAREGAPVGDDEATNRITLPYPRLGAGQRLQWPPAEGEPWSAAGDFFRLIQWDAINPSIPGVAAIATNDRAGQNTILRCYHPNLQSPAYNAMFTVPELGLHAMGLAEIAQRAYFDDFGYQVSIGGGYTLPYSFQQ